MNEPARYIFFKPCTSTKILIIRGSLKRKTERFHQPVNIIDGSLNPA